MGGELLERGPFREGYPLFYDGQPVGLVTSRRYAPTTDKYLGLALVAAEYAAVDTELDVIIREKPKKVRVVKRPFYTPAYRR